MRAIVLLFLLTLVIGVASCKKSDTSGNQNAGDASVSGASGGTSLTPPFSTKEPEKYSAMRVITSEGSGADAASEETRTFVARDGERRREDYESAGGEKISYLQLPTGNYVLLPAKKIYAELKPEAVEG